MRFYFIACLLSLAFSGLQAQQVTPNRSLTSPGGSTSSGSLNSAPTGTVPAPTAPRPQPQSSTSIRREAPAPIALPPPAAHFVPTYFHPGALVLSNGRWEGADYLINVGNNIGVFVEIIRPQDDKLPISEGQVQRIIEEVFGQSGITPTTIEAPDQPPLPFFQLQVLLYPINKGYAACCDGRLFESVSLKRIVFDPGMAFQAITWEQKTLIVAPTETAIPQLEKAIRGVAQSFADRFKSNVQKQQDFFRNSY